jgi:hypothetical protein
MTQSLLVDLWDRSFQSVQAIQRHQWLRSILWCPSRLFYRQGQGIQLSLKLQWPQTDLWDQLIQQVQWGL